LEEGNKERHFRGIGQSRDQIGKEGKGGRIGVSREVVV
jgi:hypothetical protein